MEKKCKVIKVSGEKVLLEACQNEACRTCGAACGECGKVISFWAENTLDVREGDQVLVRDASGKFLPLCAAVFFLPAFLGVAALCLSSLFLSEGKAALLGIGVFFASFLGVLLVLRKKKWDLIQMERILPKE